MTLVYGLLVRLLLGQLHSLFGLMVISTWIQLADPRRRNFSKRNGVDCKNKKRKDEYCKFLICADSRMTDTMRHLAHALHAARKLDPDSK
ncbi:hypothetical protein K438DRAFT_1829596 [Mycena galopus ATCC 62051]|nr:hypothetical protein K438DRAFT_1829596 [Mycena galopus ATCC 62051]